MEFAKRVLGGIFAAPLRFIYKNGPRSFFFWEGISDESICFELTRVDSSFWKSNDETSLACSEIIERKSNAFVIAFYLLFVAYCLYTVVGLLLYRYFFISQLAALLAGRVKGVHVTVRDRDDEGSKRSAPSDQTF